MSDPFGRGWVTAGNLYVSADGLTFGSLATADQQSYYTQFGEDAAIVWAEVRNRDLVQGGAALKTDKGVIDIGAVRAQLAAHGYTGPQDLASLAQAYALLQAPTPATPTPPVTAVTPGMPQTIALPGGLGALPTPVLIGGAVVLLLVLRRGRL